MMIALAGLAWAGYLTHNQPQILPIRELTPLQSLAVWQQELLPGVQKAPPWEESYLEGMKWYHRWLAMAGTVVALGLVTMASSFLIPKRGPRRRKKPGPKPPGKPGPART
jgi:hypothetical protein